MSSNQLGQATSPYLLLHKDNPVHWRPWGPEAFAEAEAANKPILLSIGFTACHWCHVMNRESFSDAETAAMMNESFVNILVDREERPDVDQLYQNAATAMNVRGGWPLTHFLTPKGVPYFVGGYFPKDGVPPNMPPLKSVLHDAAKLYHEQPGPLAEATARIQAQIHDQWYRDMRGTLDGQTIDTISIRVAQRFDIFFGGVLGTQKFPTVPLVELMWRSYLRSGATQFVQIMSTTLDHMLIGGLYDHVGGGFHRYTADERWQFPHFEKLSSDNAQLIGLMTLVWQHNRNAICELRTEETVAWLLREMRVGDAFATTLDADSEGEEGKYYLWSEAEIDAALAGTMLQTFKTAYGVTRDGTRNGKNILHRLGGAAPFPQSEADEALLKRQRELLLAARQKRVAPMRDDKVLADVNGIVVTALVEASQAMGRPEWTEAAIRAFDFVVKAMGDGDRLSHSWSAGKRGHAGFADDYAHMSRAALALWEATGEARFLDQAKRWVHTLNEHFWDGVLGGYFTPSDDDAPLLARTRSIYDQTQPPANSVMMGVLSRLFMITTDPSYNERCFAILRGLAGEAIRAFMSMGSYFNNIEFAGTSLQIVVVGPREHTKTKELIAAARGRSLPNRLMTVVTSSDQLPQGHAAYGKPMENGMPTAYLCQRGTCSPPIANAVALSQLLQLPPGRPAPGTKPQ